MAVPDIGIFHPQIVHFVIAFLGLGVVARVLSLLPLGERFRFLGPMATTLLILGALASVAAVQSGTNAHGPVERIPGARDAVTEHEEWGERTRNIFLGIAVLEIAALLFASRRKLAQGLRVVTALGGLVGLWAVYEVGDLGGDIVYEHAGGPGIRSGKPEDVRNLLVAGLYHNARLARDAGKKDEAARLTDELMLQMPDDPTVRFLGVESQIKDRGEPRAALLTLAAMDLPADDVRLQMRKAMLSADAYRALGAPDSATAMLQALVQRYPDNPRVKAMVERAMKQEGEAK
jgi:uncharacterized membrane protein